MPCDLSWPRAVVHKCSRDSGWDSTACLCLQGRCVQGPAQADPRGAEAGCQRGPPLPHEPASRLPVCQAPPGQPTQNNSLQVSCAHTVSLDGSRSNPLSTHRASHPTTPTLTTATTPVTTAVDLGPCLALTHGQLLRGQHSSHLPQPLPALVLSMVPGCPWENLSLGQLNLSPRALRSSYLLPPSSPPPPVFPHSTE